MMTNLKPLTDAIAFVKANPNAHNQGAADGAKRCLISYACTNVGVAGYHYEILADRTGLPVDELRALYYIMNDQEAINRAEALVAKYSPVPVVSDEPYYIRFNGVSRVWNGSVDDAKIIAKFLSDTFDDVGIFRTIVEKVDF